MPLEYKTKISEVIHLMWNVSKKRNRLLSDYWAPRSWVCIGGFNNISWSASQKKKTVFEMDQSLCKDIVLMAWGGEGPTCAMGRWLDMGTAALPTSDETVTRWRTCIHAIYIILRGCIWHILYDIEKEKKKNKRRHEGRGLLHMGRRQKRKAIEERWLKKKPCKNQVISSKWK